MQHLDRASDANGDILGTDHCTDKIFRAPTTIRDCFVDCRLATLQLHLFHECGTIAPILEWHGHSLPTVKMYRNGLSTQISYPTKSAFLRKLNLRS